jgi:DeoR/GlpR family transcriptional regulator of sugar metabolism
MSTGADQRRDSILHEMFEKGKVQVAELAPRLDVSEATVRRDLKTLSASGQVDLTHGGAVLHRSADFSFHSKGLRNLQEKRIIGKLAAGLIENGDQVFLDSGTTSFQMAPYLRTFQNLTVIANSMRLSVELHSPGLKVILLGGHYRPERMDAVGPLAVRALEYLRGYVAFIGADGLSMDFGPTASDIESAHLYGLAMHNARETVLLVDHSKFHHPSLYKIAELDTVSRIVTDRRPSDEWMDFLDHRRIDVLFPVEITK